jgi:hypothetical protein
MARSELDAILAAPWSESGYPSPDQKLLRVVVRSQRGMPGQPGEEQRVIVSVIEPNSAGVVVYEAAALKVHALSGSKSMVVDNKVTSDVTYGCPAP